MYVGRCDGRAPETECACGDEPTRADVFAERVAGQLEQNVRDIKDGEHGVIVVAFQVQVLLHACDTSIACIEVRTYSLGRIASAWLPTDVRAVNVTEHFLMSAGVVNVRLTSIQ